MAEPSTSSLPPAAADAAAAAVRAAIEKSQQPGATATETESKQEGAEEGAEGSNEPQTTVEGGLVDPSKDVTVFSDQANFTVKHPLYSPWTMWFDSASKQVSSLPFEREEERKLVWRSAGS
jgi:translation initiation factor 4E